MTTRSGTWKKCWSLFGPLLLVAATLVVPGVAAHAATGAGPVMFPNGVGADLGPSPVTLGAAVRGGDSAAGLLTGTVAGRTYWQTQVAAGTTFIGVTPDAGYASSVAAKAVVVMVTYYDSGSGELTLRTAAGDTKTVVSLTGTNSWKQGAVELAAGALTSSGGNEMRLAGATGGAPSDITVGQIRITSVGPSVTLGANPNDNGISPRAGDNAAGLITGTVAGRGYWQTNAASDPPGTNFFYMNVADSYAYNTSDIVLVSVDYFDAGNGTLDLQYDSPGTTIPDMFKQSAIASYGDTNTWLTHDFVLDDAILTNRSNGSDFRIAHDGSGVEVKIAAVRTTIIARQLDLKAGLRNLVATANLAVYGAREGTRDGQYPPGSKAAFAAVIAQAQAVIDDTAATETQVAEALQTLFDAYQAFRASAVNTDLAKSAVMTASSSAPGTSPSAVNDGDPATVWTSGSGGTGEWLQADLGTVQPVNDVLVQWGHSYSPDYTVELSSDGTTYTTVGHSGAPGNSSSARTRFATTTARYVRLGITGYPAGVTSFDVAGFQVRNQRAVQPKPTLIRTKYPTADAVVADFDATAYGADPKAVRDSTKAIQAALYDCYDSGGGTVWLPEGTYRVTDTVEIPAFCTLRGDRRDPDQGHGGYGTVVNADFPPGDNGPVLFRIGGSAGVVGVTTYYPRQSATNPVPYNYTFQIPGSAWASDENYMMSTVSDVTMLNSYRGITSSTMLDERGRPPAVGQTHESATVRNVSGTALLEGVAAFNSADVGTWENVKLSNAYWADAPAAYHPPKRSTLDAWTRAHGTGFILGDLEWDQFFGLSAADYHIGIRVVKGQRADFTGVFLQTRIVRTDTALQVEQFDARWGLSLAASDLEGSVAAVDNRAPGGYVKVTGTKLVGAVTGTVHQLAGTVPGYDQKPAAAKPARAVLYDVTKAPYNTPRGNGYTPAQDATGGIQLALDRAKHDGGGVVYLPAGWYRLDGHLVVPAGVELRGASPVPNRDEDGRSGGTVLMSYAGRNAADADTAQAAITLGGDRSGVSGLRIFYPENNPAAPGGLVPYPYAIRGHADGTYVVNVGMPNAWNAIDMATYRNDHFLVRKVDGTFVRHGITVGRSEAGRIEGVLTNGNTFVRTAFYLPNWVLGSDIFPQVIDRYTRVYSDLITVDGARGLTVFDAFGYGLHNGLIVNSGDVRVFNQGTDNLGTDGFTVKVATGNVSVVNLMRYNGTTSTGPVKLVNIMVINIVEHSVTAAVSPAGSGTAALAGNETLPGVYEQGSQVTASAKAAPGFSFVNWTVGGTEVSTSPAYTFTVTGDLALTANFAPV